MFRIGFVFLASFCFSSLCVAQLSDFQRSKLALEIETAAKNVDVKLFPTLDESKSDVKDKIDAAKRFLQTKTSRQNADAWLSYLDLEALEENLAEDGSLPVLAREAVALRFRLVGTAPGLELTVLRNLRDSIEQLVEAIRFRNPEKAVESLGKQLEALAKRVRELEDSPSAEDSASISALLGVLSSSGQATQVVDSMRSTFSRPNIAILVGEGVVKNAVYRNVNQARPVNDCILGTRIVGTATMNGAVSADLLPALGAARVNVSLVGHVTSNNVGYNGPVKLRTVGHGDVTVTRALNVNESGVSLEPTYAHAVLSTQITAIEHRLRLVRRIARKRAAEQKPQADRIALGKMRSQVSNQFTQEVNQAAAARMPDLVGRFLPVLKRLSLSEPSRLWGSTTDNVFIDSTFRRSDQLAAVVSRPGIGEPFDAAIQVHESLVDNLFAPVLGGRTLKESQLNELMQRAGQPTPNAKDAEKEEPPFEIDFARLQPIVFEARDQAIRIGVRGTRFAQGKRELKRSMEIAASYQPARGPDGMMLTRSGDVEVSFPGSKRLSVTQAGLKRTIQKKFSDVFPETLLHRPLEVPATTQIDALRGRVYRPQLVDARDGWLTIAVR